MENTDPRPELSTEGAPQLLDLMDAGLKSASLDQFAAAVLPAIAALMGSPEAFLYISDPRFSPPALFQHPARCPASFEAERWCADLFERVPELPGSQPFRLPASSAWEASAELVVYPLRAGQGCSGLLGFVSADGTAPFPPALMERLLRTIAVLIEQLGERLTTGLQLAHLNSYLTVSSMLAQSQDLHEELEVALYCCMEQVAAEEASVLLLDDEKRSFRFYQVEGLTKPVLETAVFPADKGLAGAVLQSQQSEVINFVSQDPRFYGQIDAETGVQTHNMIVIPLTAGEERVGVLEVLNKAGGADFTEGDHLLLLSFAEEIAFAIRNARVFEYVADSYCKQRQGLASCKGCQRPLGSWTPCVRYREALL
jgi:GAF domain-containing protein